MTQATIIRPDIMVNHDESLRLESELHGAISADCDVVIIDCSEVEYINSRAMGSIIQAYMALSERGRTLRLVCNDDGFVRKGFETVGVLAFIDSYSSLQAATEA